MHRMPMTDDEMYRAEQYAADAAAEQMYQEMCEVDERLPEKDEDDTPAVETDLF